LRLAAQNLHWEEAGAFTGEVSGAQIQDAGCSLVLVGHSERRRLFGETDEIVRRKVARALKQGLEVILCIGETLEQRLGDQTPVVVKGQMREGLADAGKEFSNRILIAYEPVWAIGTGRVATAEQISEVHALIRLEYEKLFDSVSADAVRILYGGSVTSENIADLAAIADLDGVLVGGASLNADRFGTIIRGLQKAKA